MLKTISLFILSALLACSANAQTDSTKAHSRELLVLTGSGTLGIQMMKQMIVSFKKEMPDVPAEFWNEFIKDINPNELIELIVPVYAKYFTDAELVELLQFYKSKIGQKYISQLPAIMQDSYSVGQAWGKIIGEKAMSKLVEKGYLKGK